MEKARVSLNLYNSKNIEECLDCGPEKHQAAKNLELCN